MGVKCKLEIVCLEAFEAVIIIIVTLYLLHHGSTSIYY